METCTQRHMGLKLKENAISYNVGLNLSSLFSEIVKLGERSFLNQNLANAILSFYFFNSSSSIKVTNFLSFFLTILDNLFIENGISKIDHHFWKWVGYNNTHELVSPWTCSIKSIKAHKLIEAHFYFYSKARLINSHPSPQPHGSSCACAVQNHINLVTLNPFHCRLTI